MNDPFNVPFTHALISTLHGRSINPRGALYALMNCPCLIFCPRGVVQFALFGNGLSVTPGVFVTDEFVVSRVVVAVCVVLIFPSVLNSAHEFTGAVGWIYSLSTF